MQLWNGNEVKDEGGGGGGGQSKREVGDEGRDMEMRGREEEEGRIIKGKREGWGKRGKFCARAASRIEEGGKGEGSSVPPCPPLKDVFRCPRVRVGGRLGT